VSVYGFEPESRTLSVSWSVRRARRVKVVAMLPDGVLAQDVDRLAWALEGLSEALWDTYVHPASQFGDPEEANTEAWRWGLERAAFEEALAAVRAPYLPEHGMLTVSYCRVKECGHRVGRALHALDLGPEFAALIAAEVECEQAAVEAAEAGDLTGRAAQAVVLSRIGASPTQIEVAWQALLADPLGCHPVLLTEFEPSAAAIAAARCLRCAAEITAEVSGVDWTDVVMEADNIEALPVLTPSTVLALLAEGSSEWETVTGLLREAHAVAEGKLSGLGQLASVVEQVRRLSEAGVGDEALELRLTPLDPRRPAPDLLEDLLTGIDGCFLLWREYADDAGLPDPAADADLPADRDAAMDSDSVKTGPDGSHLPDTDLDEVDVEDAEDDDEVDEKWYAEASRRFSDELRDAMHALGSPA
jgi:hypothetical protein